MRFFTPELFVRYQNLDTAVMDEADAEWEDAERRYEDSLRRLGSTIEPLQQQFANVLLHDAQVCSISWQGEWFTIVLHKDIPPRQLVTLRYRLTQRPLINPEALPEHYRSGVMQFQCDEFDVAREPGQDAFVHSILFSNGWEIQVRFREVQVVLAEPVYPVPGTLLIPTPASLMPRSA